MIVFFLSQSLFSRTPVRVLVKLFKIFVFVSPNHVNSFGTKSVDTRTAASSLRDPTAPFLHFLGLRKGRFPFW